MPVYENTNKALMPYLLMLGFASGLPLALTGSTLQAWYASENIPIISIGFLTLVELPYLLKFVWAPFFDRYRLPFLDSRRGFIAASQFVLMIILLLMSWMSPESAPLMLAFFALLLAFASASQDIAFDAYRTEKLEPAKRGVGTFWSVTGYRMAMLCSGGLALIMADHIGFGSVFLLMSALMLLSLYVTQKSPRLADHSQPTSIKAAFVEPFKEFWSRSRITSVLALILTFKLGDAFLGSLSTTFLLRGVGLSLTDIGTINKVAGLFASMLGVYLGGLMIMKMAFNQVVLIALILQVVSNLGYWILAIGEPLMSIVWLALSIEQLSGGVGTAALVALVMGLCHKKYAAVQFALLTSFAGLARVVVGPVAGYVVDGFGWDVFILSSIPIGFLSVYFLKLTWNEIGQLSQPIASVPDEKTSHNTVETRA